MNNIKLFYFCFCLLFSSCCSNGGEELKVVSLFANKSTITYRFYNENNQFERELDYEKSDTCNAAIMNSAIVASSELYVCDLLAKDSKDTKYVEVYFDKGWHLLERDSTIKEQSIEQYLIGQPYQLKEGDSIISNNEKMKYSSSGNNVFEVKDVDDDYIVLLPVTFVLDDCGDATKYEIQTEQPQITFRWKNGYEVVPMRIVCEW